MPDQSPHQGRRPHFHRGRRGPDRRGGERRTSQSSPEPAARDHVDVEQIMRDIRARISQRHGIELTNQQVQELAARRLEAILEPRNVNPSLLEQLRKSAGATVDVPQPAPEAGYELTATALYDTHRGVLRVFRKLLNPVLKLFFNPTPLIEALQAQAAINRAAAARDAERDRRQAEWNALHYELLQHMVTEVSRISIDIQAFDPDFHRQGRCEGVLYRDHLRHAAAAGLQVQHHRLHRHGERWSGRREGREHRQ